MKPRGITKSYPPFLMPVFGLRYARIWLTLCPYLAYAMPVFGLRYYPQKQHLTIYRLKIYNAKTKNTIIYIISIIYYHPAGAILTSPPPGVILEQ